MTKAMPIVYFDVLHDIDSMECASGNTMTGTLALQLGPVAFPDPDWNDFIVRTLTPWVISARLVLTTNACETFPFMDGAPEFTAIRRSIAAIEIICYESHDFRGGAPRAIVDPLQFGHAIYTVARKAKNWADRNQCERANVHHLANGIHALKDVI